MKYSYILLIFISNFVYGQHPLMSGLDSSLYPQFVAVQSGDWDNPSVWEGGVIPSDNASVMIPIGIDVRITTELDARHKFIHVDGSLFMAIHYNTLLKVETLFIETTGYFRIGLPDYRVKPTKQAKIIFISDNEPIDRAWDSKQITRGLMSMGKIRIYGKIKTHQLEFQQDIAAGQSSITFSETIPADWEVGDELVLPGTSFVRDQSFEDEVLKIAGITGNTIQLETPTLYDHIRLRDDQSLHLANLTRNVIFESESTDNPNQRRGHLMFMKPDVKIEHAAMIGLGRTDKSKPLDEIVITVDRENTEAPVDILPGSRDNVRGRYAVHFHKNGYGTNVNNPPSKILGCVVRSTQGWGFVNHSSHVHFEKNVCYEFVGSGFVTESGDELGTFSDNIAIKGIGEGVYREIRLVFRNEDRPQPLSDFAFSGEGFWFQGPAVRAVNNVAANCNGAGMFWFTMGSVEIADNEMIGMDKDIALQVYTLHPEIENWNPRTWKHDPNEVLLADLPILECRDFTGYANFAGFRIRMNNSPATAFLNADAGGGDVFGYMAQIEPAEGYTGPGPADRLQQEISNLELWNNEIGIRTRYSDKTSMNQIIVDNGLRYGDNRRVFPGISSHHRTFAYSYDNTDVRNYGLGILAFKKVFNIEHPGLVIKSVDLKNVASDFHDMEDAVCSDASSIEAINIITTSATIKIADHPELQTMVVRYKSEKDHYWNYTSIDNSNSIQLQNLNIDTEYTYQVLVGCEFSPSQWSEDKSFTTKCTNVTGGYAIGTNWIYDTFTASACLGDYLKIRLWTITGSSTYTKPDGSVVNGNIYNTLFINPVEPKDFGIYTVEYTDAAGCVSSYSFNVIRKNPKDGGYAIGSEWTYGTFTASACIGDYLRIRLRTSIGSSIYTKPDGSVMNGNHNNTLFIDPVSDNDYGTYTVEYTDEMGCVNNYSFNVIRKNPKGGGYAIGSEWTYGTFTASACIGDYLRIRLRTSIGSSIYTKPDGSVVNGNHNNTLFINPVSNDDYGIYTVEYTDQTGCVNNYSFNVVPDPSECPAPKIEDKNPTEFKLYPNPVLDNDVLFLSGAGIKHVEVFDLAGRQLNTQNFDTQENPVEINCSDFESGIYFVRINGQYVSKFIVQK